MRNDYGFPIADEPQSLCMQLLGFDLFKPLNVAQPAPPSKWELARQYAAEARERNKPPCDCEACKRDEMLPAVLNIINNWRSPK